MTHLFHLLASFSVRRPRTVLALLLLALGLSGAALVHLPIHTSNLDLIDQDLPEVKRFLDFAHEFGTPNVLVVTFEGADEAALQAAVDELGPQFRALPGVRTVIDRVPYDPAVLRDVGADPYLASEKRDLFMVFVQPSDPHSRADTIAPLIEGVRGVLSTAHLQERGVKPGMTGVPVYAIDDRDVIQRDMSKLSFLSFGLIAVLFVAAFRSLRRPLLAMIALFAGVLLTAGLIRFSPATSPCSPPSSPPLCSGSASTTPSTSSTGWRNSSPAARPSATPSRRPWPPRPTSWPPPPSPPPSASTP
jgi:predicted RND superfamily exporter protein